MTLTPDDNRAFEIPISKGKRSKRPRVDYMERAEEFLAIWLVELRHGYGSVSRASRRPEQQPDTAAVPSLSSHERDEGPVDAVQSLNTSEKDEELEAAVPSLTSPKNEESVAAAAAVLSSNTAPETLEGEPPRKKQATESPHSQLDGQSNHKCNFCDKVFPSYQALGGHKTSHRTKPTPTTDPPVSNSTGNVPTPNISSLNPSGKAHTCPICQKSFPSGQALGGHMRRHQDGPIGSRGGHNTSDKAIVPTNTTSGGDSSSIDRGSEEKNPYLFDLNLPPLPEPEEEPDLVLQLNWEGKRSISSSI